MTLRVFLLLLLACAVPAAAQEAVEEQILVEGMRPMDRDEVSDLVASAYPRTLRVEPVMRFHDPICVQVNGLGASGNRIVLEKMRETIRSLEIPLAAPGCRGNAVVVVSAEPMRQLEEIHERTPRILTADTLEQKAGEIESGSHFVVWHNRVVRGSDGEALPISGAMAGWTGLGGVNALVNNNGRPTRARAGYSVAADVGVVAYDAGKLDDVDLEQLASNAVMRLLAPGFAIEIEPGSPETVLSGIENGAGPEELTRFDRAVLTALYSMAPNEFGRGLPRAVGNAYEDEE